jgi:hypothetical protein
MNRVEFEKRYAQMSENKKIVYNIFQMDIRLYPILANTNIFFQNGKLWTL